MSTDQPLSSKVNLFVYGTLRKGKHNHHILRNSKCLGEFHTERGLGLIVQGLPFLVEDVTGPGCWGELYEVDRNVLSDCDRLEGHPDFYKRTLIDVIDPETKRKEPTWAYIYQGEFRNATFTRRY